MDEVKKILIEIINLAEGPNAVRIVNAAARLALAERERILQEVEEYGDGVTAAVAALRIRNNDSQEGGKTL